jgi:hypothetical protein
VKGRRRRRRRRRRKIIGRDVFAKTPLPNPSPKNSYNG